MANHHTRVDTSELKDMIYQKIGHKRAEKYFNQLQKFLTLKLSKVQFNKSCFQTIGRENIPLHNKLIRVIVQNACQSKAPPLKSRKVQTPGRNKVVSGNHIQSIYSDAFPRKYGSPIDRDRKFWDRPSPFGPLGKSPSLTCEETVTRLQEQQSASELHSLSSKPPLDDGEEVEQLDEVNDAQRWSHITSPLGVSADRHKSDAIKFRQCKFLSNATCQSSRELPDTVSLLSHLKRKLEPEGLGISVDCSRLLNTSLDLYLKGLIEPCLDITRSRCLRDQCNNGEGFSIRIPRLNQPGRQRSSSMLDFRVAMESNPSLLGSDWPVKLEKISHYSMEE